MVSIGGEKMSFRMKEQGDREDCLTFWGLDHWISEVVYSISGGVYIGRMG